MRKIEERPKCRKPGCGALMLLGRPCTDWDCPQLYVAASDYATVEAETTRLREENERLTRERDDARRLAYANAQDAADESERPSAEAGVKVRELWALCYLHDWDPPLEGQEHRWEPGKNVFPEVHAFYHSQQEAEAIRRDMINPEKYWVVRARAEDEARLAKATLTPAQEPEGAVDNWLSPEEEALIVEDINSGRWPYLQPSPGEGPSLYTHPSPPPVTEEEPTEALSKVEYALTKDSFAEGEKISEALAIVRAARKGRAGA